MVAHYIMDPSALRDQYPEVYAHMKKLFGREYIKKGTKPHWENSGAWEGRAPSRRGTTDKLFEAARRRLPAGKN